MNLTNNRKTLSVYPEIEEIEYSSKIDTEKLNTQLRSIEESALRAILRGKELNSEMTRLELGLVKSYQAMANKYASIVAFSDDKAYANAFNVTNNKTTPGGILYDEDYGTVTLNPIDSYSKIPRGQKYDGKVSPQVTMYLDGTEISVNSEAYDALDGTNKYFWIEEVSPNTQYTVRIDLPPSLTKRFNYMELSPYPLFGMSIDNITYTDFSGKKTELDKYFTGTANPLVGNYGNTIKLYMSPKEYNGTVEIKVTSNSLGIIGFSNIDIKFNDYDNTTKTGWLKFDGFKKDNTYTLNNIVLDYYLDGKSSNSLITVNESPINVILRKGEESDGEVTYHDDELYHKMDLARTLNSSYSLNLSVSLTENQYIYLYFEMTEQNNTTPVIRGAKIDFTEA